MKLEGNVYQFELKYLKLNGSDNILEEVRNLQYTYVTDECDIPVI
jgi:hypothetical protein